MAKKHFILFALSALLGLSAALLASVMFIHRWPVHPVMQFPLTPCPIGSSFCQSTLPTGEKIQLLLHATPLKRVIPIEVHIELSQFEALEAQITFEGQNHATGENTLPLNQTSLHSFHGSTILPILKKPCRTWQATLVLETEHGRLTAPFAFEVAYENMTSAHLAEFLDP